MLKRKILVLDCTPGDQPSEGTLLKSFFDICRIDKPTQAASLYYRVTSKSELLSKLSNDTKYNIIHISAHGTANSIGNGSTWSATADEISETTHPKAQLVHISACSTCSKKLADAFNSKYFLAPSIDVPWIDAAMFSLMFYKRYIVDGISLDQSFKYARTRTQTATIYKDYWL